MGRHFTGKEGKVRQGEGQLGILQSFLLFLFSLLRSVKFKKKEQFLWVLKLYGGWSHFTRPCRAPDQTGQMTWGLLAQCSRLGDVRLQIMQGHWLHSTAGISLVSLSFFREQGGQPRPWKCDLIFIFQLRYLSKVTWKNLIKSRRHVCQCDHYCDNCRIVYW